MRSHSRISAFVLQAACLAIQDILALMTFQHSFLVLCSYLRYYGRSRKPNQAPSETASVLDKVRGRRGNRPLISGGARVVAF